MNTVARPSATASPAAASPATTAFPNELVFLIAAHMDPVTDRDALLSLLCVSQVAWEAAARVLYRHMSVDTGKLANLLCPGGNISHRTRRALTFTKSLHIITPLRPAAVYALWTAAAGAETPRTPLFPRAERVRFVDGPTVYNTDRHISSRDERPDEHVRVFNNPDMCITGYYAHEQYLLLQPCSIRAVTYHGCDAYIVLGRLLPEQCTSLQIFDYAYDTRCFMFAPRKIGIWEEDLRSEKRKDLPTARICATSRRADYDRFLVEAEEESDWVPAPESRVQFEWYPAREGYKCTPCSVCGHRWRRMCDDIWEERELWNASDESDEE